MLGAIGVVAIALTFLGSFPLVLAVVGVALLWAGVLLVWCSFWGAVIGGAPKWEGARQAAQYSGVNARGERITRGTKADFERPRPIVGSRVQVMDGLFNKTVPEELLERVRRTSKMIRDVKRGSKPPRKARATSEGRGPGKPRMGGRDLDKS